MSTYEDSIAIIIPALNPDKKMIALVQGLKEHGFETVILVDDGSRVKKRIYFKRAKEEFGCHVIRHVVNFGKGMALKSAFNYILKNMPDIKGVVTVDCDGQHTLADTIRCAELTLENPDKLVLGCRQFTDKSIPLRSRFGNKLTRFTIRFLCGLSVSDTQTGLRGMSRELLNDHLCATKGERFEYEMNMLIQSKESGIPILEFPIKTIYLENNGNSHFNPFRDSLRIYCIFLKFMLISFTSYLIDIVCYILIFKLIRTYFDPSTNMLATFGARGISSLYNFLMNKNQVFHNHSKAKYVALKYYALCITQALISAKLVEWLFYFSRCDEVIIKSCVEIFLCFISFQIQKNWVFKTERKHP